MRNCGDARAITCGANGPTTLLQATALVHEAYLRMVDDKKVTWESRAHFYGIAARVMRRILVDHARAHQTQKRGGLAQKFTSR